MSDWTYYADDNFWKAHSIRASEPPNQGFMPRWSQGTPGTNEPGLLWSNEYGYGYLKQGDHLVNIRGGVHGASQKLKTHIDACTRATNNPAGCQFQAMAMTGPHQRHPFRMSYQTGAHVHANYIPPNGRP